MSAEITGGGFVLISAFWQRREMATIFAETSLSHMGLSPVGLWQIGTDWRHMWRAAFCWRVSQDRRRPPCPVGVFAPPVSSCSFVWFKAVIRLVLVRPRRAADAENNPKKHLSALSTITGGSKMMIILIPPPPFPLGIMGHVFWGSKTVGKISWSDGTAGAVGEPSSSRVTQLAVGGAHTPLFPGRGGGLLDAALGTWLTGAARRKGKA